MVALAPIAHDLQLERVVAVAHDDARVRARRGEGLLHDPVRGHVDPRGQRRRRALDRQLSAVRQQPLQVGQAGPRARCRLRFARAQDPEQPAQLAERLAARFLDRQQRRPRALRIIEHQPRRARLHRHDAHAVRDDVVQVARDPPPLRGHRRPLAPLALRLGRRHLALQLHGPLRPPLQRERRQRERRARERHADSVGGLDARVTPDDHREARTADGHAGDGLPRLVLRAGRPEREQQRERVRIQARDGRAIHRRERAIGAEDADRRRERKPAAQQERQRGEEHDRHEHAPRRRHRRRDDLDLRDDRERHYRPVERVPLDPARDGHGRPTVSPAGTACIVRLDDLAPT